MSTTLHQYVMLSDTPAHVRCRASQGFAPLYYFTTLSPWYIKFLGLILPSNVVGYITVLFKPNQSR